MNDLINKLAALGVSLRVDKGELKVKAKKGVLNKDVILQLKENKAELIKMLTKFSLPSIEKAPKQQYYPVTPSQYRLWVSCQLGAIQAYNMPFFTKGKGSMDFEHLKEAYKLVIKEHDSIRTVFRENEKNQISQYIIDAEDFDYDFRYHDNTAGQINEKELVDEVLQHTFDLVDGPLVMMGVVENADDSYMIYIMMHHLISDGWSFGVFLNQIIEKYKSIKDNTPMPVKASDIQYTDYSVWLNACFEEIHNNEYDFWMQMFKDEQPLLELPFEKKRPARRKYEGGYFEYMSTEEYNDKIEAFCKKMDVTPFSFKMACYKILLHKYSNLTDITVGFPISGRVNDQLEDQIGLFINTLPARLKFSVEDTFAEILNKESELLKKCQDNQLFSMDHILENLNIQQAPGHSPLFDTLVAYQNQNTINLFGSEEELPISLDLVDFDLPASQFDIGWGMTVYKKKLVIALNYYTGLYEEEQMKLLMDDYVFMLEFLVDNPNVPLGTLLGSLDRKFLSDYEFSFDTEEETEEKSVTSTTTENPVLLSIKQIVDQYAEGLGFEDDYFGKGGNSLGAIQIVSDINEQFDTNLSIIDFYNNASISKIYGLIKENIEANDGNAAKRTAVKEIFEKYIDDVGYDDDYFGKGGNSLGAIQIVADINEHFDVNLSIIEFYTNGTINKIVELIGGGNSPDAEELMISFAEAKEELPNLFFFPPIIGASLLFKPLMDMLEGDFNSYGFNMPIIEEEGPMVAQVVKMYYDEIIKLSPKGSTVYLLGYSIGVHSAFEVAKLLEKHGINTQLLLIDRGAETDSDFELTEELISKVIDDHRPLIESISTGKEMHEIFESRIRQTLGGMQDYRMQGTVNGPIWAFESKENGFSGYMESWKEFSTAETSITLLEGGHYDVMSEINRNKIFDSLNSIVNEPQNIY